MNWKLLDETGEKTFVVVFDPGEEVASGLLSFAKDRGLAAARFTAIGALSDVVLGFFDLDKKEYLRNPLTEQVEVLSLVGNVAEYQGKPRLHAHVVVGKRDGGAWGGHLLEAHVRPTLEVMLVESPKHLQRTIDPATSLPLLSPGKAEPR